MYKQRDPNQPLNRTEIHDVLSNDRRWRVIELLSDDNPRELRSLADEIAAAESGDSPAPRTVRQSVYVTLHQNHLPKLDSLGIVEYDDTSKTVTLGACANEIDAYVRRSEPTWHEFNLGIAVVGLAGTLASYAGVSPLAAFDPTLYAMTALVVLLGSVVVQLRERNRRRTSEL